MNIITQDVNEATQEEIREMLSTHGDCCISFLEQKFDVLILGDNQTIEIYQLPTEGE